jgi:hypothetical protein
MIVFIGCIYMVQTCGTPYHESCHFQASVNADRRLVIQEMWMERCVYKSNQGEGREGVETAIHRASPSVMRASRGVRRSNCKQIWLRVHDSSEGMLKLLLYKILLV